jgi:hypothetical protein
MVVLGLPPAGAAPVPLGLQQGDVILTSPITPSMVDGVIFSAQQLVYPLDDAAWTHAAIYVGNGMVVDAQPVHNVAVRTFQNLIAGCHFRVLRLQGIGPQMQWDVCHAALGLQGKYGYLAAITDGLIQNAPLPSHWKQLVATVASSARGRDHFYCSQLVNEAYVAAAQVSVVSGRSYVPLPAAFSASGLFADMQVRWI